MIEIRARIIIEGCDELEETAKGVETLTSSLKRKFEGASIYVIRNKPDYSRPPGERSQQLAVVKNVDIDSMECVD